MNPDLLPGRLPGNRHPDWQLLYEREKVESLPWYESELDRDLRAALEELPPTGGTFLDLGTGPGTQAAQLARLEFRVTGTDFSGSAVRFARRRFPSLRFFVDDILQSRLCETFDYIFDRGCFHVLEPAQHARYVASVSRLCKPGGTFFLKCFSDRQPDADFGPLRFSESDLRALFGTAFSIEQVRHTHYGNADRSPRALFVAMRRQRQTASTALLEKAAPGRSAAVEEIPLISSREFTMSL